MAVQIGSIFVPPNERVPLEVGGGNGIAGHRLIASAGRVTTESVNRWTWQAPSSAGTYRLDVIDASGRLQTRFNAFVTTPATAVVRGRLDGYTIGRYPIRAVKNDVVYEPPAGFIQVTMQNESVALSPHFRLRDFVCKQAGAYPKYVVLQEALILKLERILSMLRAHGYGGATLNLLSGYRTPAYNRAIGNVAYSMHLWGGAADVIVDADFNGDGQVDREDAALVSRWLDESDRQSDAQPSQGGLGVYGATRAHGPFIHVDVRPARARWGD